MSADRLRVSSAPIRGGHRVDRTTRLAVAISVSAAAAPISGASPVGSEGLDWIWGAGLAALGAFLAVSTRRVPLLLAATIAVASATTALSVVFGGVAVVATVFSTRNPRRRAVFSRGIGGGFTVCCLLATAPRLGWAHSLTASATVSCLLAVSGLRHMRRSRRRRVYLVAGALFMYAVVASALATIGVITTRDLVASGTADLRAGLSAARQGDADAASEHLAAARVALARVQSQIDRWGMGALVVPVASQHVLAIKEASDAAQVAAAQAAQVATILADQELGVRAGRVDLEAVAKLESPLRRLSTALEAVVSVVERRSGSPLLPALNRRLEDLGSQSTRAAREASLGAEAAEVIPNLLGRSEPRRYLVLFTSPAEARGRFGFPASFAEVTFDQGRIDLGEHGSTSQTFLGQVTDQSKFDLGDDLLRPYVPLGTTASILSATAPPDFQIVAKVAAEIWAQSGRVPVHGVIRFDPASLARLIQLTGEVGIEGLDTPLSANNLERFLLVDQYVQFPTAQAPRRELLDAVAATTFERLEVANLPPPRVLSELFHPAVTEGHLHMTSFETSEARFFDRINLSGQFPAPPSDGLLLTSLNGLGNKIDAFMTRSVNYEGSVRDGELDAVLSVDLHNAAPPAGLPLYVIGSTRQPAPPAGTNRTIVLVYTSVPVDVATLGGEPIEFLRQRSGGRWVHQITVDIPPQSTRRLRLSLRGELPDGDYGLVLEPGGGTEPDQYVIRLDIDGHAVTFDGLVVSQTRVN